jgi:hypothetical protein
MTIIRAGALALAALFLLSAALPAGAQDERRERRPEHHGYDHRYHREPRPTWGWGQRTYVEAPPPIVYAPPEPPPLVYGQPGLSFGINIR